MVSIFFDKMFQTKSDVSTREKQIVVTMVFSVFILLSIYFVTS